MLFTKISYLHTLKYLFLRSIKITTPGLKDKMINSLIWSTLNIVIFTYIMPSLGLNKDFGTFMVATMPTSCAFFTTINSLYALLTDISGEGSNLTYELILPIPQWLVFTKYAFENMFQALAVSAMIIPIGKILLWNSFSLAYFSFFKFYFLLFVASIFFGFFSIFITSITKDIYSGLDNVWIRIIFPIWFLGGFQFSWKTLYGISPVLAYLNLLNPLTFALEGGRAAALHPDLSIPYWYCIGALLIFASIFGYIGIQNLKKRLDCLH